MGGGVTFTATAAKVNVPTGTVVYTSGKFTVPNGITVLEFDCTSENVPKQYVGVTHGSTHVINIYTQKATEVDPAWVSGYCDTHKKEVFYFEWADEPYLGSPEASVNISWSPEINKHTCSG